MEDYAFNDRIKAKNLSLYEGNLYDFDDYLEYEKQGFENVEKQLITQLKYWQQLKQYSVDFKKSKMIDDVRFLFFEAC